MPPFRRLTFIVAILLALPLETAFAQKEFISRTFRKRGKETPLLGPTLIGQTGLYDVYSADRFPKGGVGVSLFSTYFKQDQFLSPTINHAKQDAFLSFTVAPFETTEQLGMESGFEFSLMGKVTSDRVKDTQVNESRQVQAAGDVAVGFKYSLNPWGPLYTGINAFGFFLTGEESGSYDGSATGGAGRALITLDFAEGKSEESIGFRVHLNGGYAMDRSENLLAKRKFPVPMSERFALGVNGEDQYLAGAGFEVIRTPVAFVAEGSLSYDTDSTILDDDEQPFKIQFRNNPLYLTPGLRLLPFENLVIDLAVRLGQLTEPIAFTEERSEKLVPDLTYVFGMSYTDLPKRARVKRVVKKLAQIRGIVTDEATQAPVGGAVISFVDPPDIPAVASDPEKGTYLVQNLKPGAYSMKIERPGYHPQNAEAEIKATETVELNIQIAKIPDIVLGTLEGRVEDPNGNPLVAVITVDRDRGRTGTSPATGQFSIALEEGDHSVMAESQGFKPYVKDVAIQTDKPTQILIVLEPREKVRVTQDKIVIYEKVNFRTGAADILPVSYSILDAVVDVMKKYPQFRVRVEGHTDNVGGRKRNIELSQDRAEAVTKYLESKGVDESRLEAKGYADTVPLADNESAEGRSKNRRVEFTILAGQSAPPDSRPAAPAAPPTTPAPGAPSPAPTPSATPAGPAAPSGPLVEIVDKKPVEAFSVPGGPLTGGSVVGTVKPKSKVPLLDQKGDWLKVRLPNGQEGWINKRSTRPLVR
ncbi:MAG: OmpA family protein [Nitrospirae bacterium]|nr:OmpA family protein [Nitrospirota bacterium]